MQSDHTILRTQPIAPDEVSIWKSVGLSVAVQLKGGLPVASARPSES